MCVLIYTKLLYTNIYHFYNTTNRFGVLAHPRHSLSDRLLSEMCLKCTSKIKRHPFYTVELLSCTQTSIFK